MRSLAKKGVPASLVLEMFQMTDIDLGELSRKEGLKRTGEQQAEYSQLLNNVTSTKRAAARDGVAYMSQLAVIDNLDQVFPNIPDRQRVYNHHLYLGAAFLISYQLLEQRYDAGYYVLMPRMDANEQALFVAYFAAIVELTCFVLDYQF